MIRGQCTPSDCFCDYGNCLSETRAGVATSYLHEANNRVISYLTVAERC